MFKQFTYKKYRSLLHKLKENKAFQILEVVKKSESRGVGCFFTGEEFYSQKVTMKTFKAWMFLLKNGG